MNKNKKKKENNNKKKKPIEIAMHLKHKLYG